MESVIENKKLYPITSQVLTTREQTIIPNNPPSPQTPIKLKDVEDYKKMGYGTYHLGLGIDDGKRSDIMPIDYDSSKATNEALLLNFLL